MLSLDRILGKESPIDKYSYVGNLRVLDLSCQKILIKQKNRYEMEKIYQYLDDHHIHNYLRPIGMDERNIIFPYLENNMLTADEKAKKMVYNLSLWQNKSTIHQDTDIDQVKEIYETYQKKIQYVSTYYSELQDMVETKVYMHPVEYLFIRNVSMIYEALGYCSSVLEEWFKIASVKKTRRKVYCHGKCEIDHFLANDDGYFISLENAHIGDVSEDFVYFYKHNFLQVDMLSTFRFYQQKFPFTKEEKLYFYLQIALPKVIDLYPSSLQKSQELVLFFELLKSTSLFLLDQQEYNKNN